MKLAEYFDELGVSDNYELSKHSTRRNRNVLLDTPRQIMHAAISQKGGGLQVTGPSKLP